MDRNEIIAHVLSLPDEAIRRGLTTQIRMANPTRYVCESSDIYGEVQRFSAKGHCQLQVAPDFNSDIGESVYQGLRHWGPRTAWFEIEWNGEQLDFVVLQLREGFHRQPYVVLTSNSEAVTGAFLIALEKFSSTVEGAVLVFQDGCWRHDEDLYAEIRSSTFDNLVLPVGMSEQIRDDVQNWIDSKSLYEQHGIPWKRGMILVGPPGNGKTHMIKALVNHFSLSALYVRGFTAEYKSDSENISAVFHKARACAPAVLILEDLDTLVNPSNRSHFLNELDGFSLNSGILTVASANDPTKLDPALVNRPSRFDRRYVFDLPEAVDRSRYLQFFTSSLDSSLHLAPTVADEIASATEGFSFAYLKELVLSSMMAWISTSKLRAFHSVMLDNVSPLLTQMGQEPEQAADSSEILSPSDAALRARYLASRKRPRF